MVLKARKERGYRSRSSFYHISDGYYFHRNRVFPNGKVSLRCVKYYSRRCMGRAVMDFRRTNFEHRGHHNHGPDAHFISIRKLRDCILDRCRADDPTPLKVIVHEEGGPFRRRVRSKVLPDRIRSAANRARHSNRPNVPHDLTTLASVLRNPVYRSLCTTTDQKDFLYAGSCGKASEKSRCVIFISRRFKRLMGRVTKVHADGTWKARPRRPNSHQLFCIVTEIDHQDVCLYGKKLGMTNFIRQNRHVERYVRCCCAIPLLPGPLLEAGLAAIVVASFQFGIVDEMALLLNYIMNEWIKKRGDVLSVYDCEHRTNNCCESFHALMMSLIGRKRPSIWRFLQCLKIMEDMTFQDLHAMCEGERVRRLRKNSALVNDENIRNLTARLLDGLIDIITFLRQASRRVQGVFDSVFPPLIPAPENG